MSVPAFSPSPAACAVATPAAPPGIPHRILVVDDEADIREPMQQFLLARGFAVGTAEDGAGLHAQLARKSYDLVLLDVMLHGDDGFTLCRQLRERHGPPVILLTARGETADRVHGLDTGADDYIVKPFDPNELVARIRTVLRRSSREAAPARPRHFSFDGWRFDLLQHELRHDDGRQVALSAGETRLLHALITHANEVLGRDRLLSLCADADTNVFDRSIDSHVSRLRRKIELDPRRPRLLRTVWGDGYMLAAHVEVTAWRAGSRAA